MGIVIQIHFQQIFPGREAQTNAKRRHSWTAEEAEEPPRSTEAEEEEEEEAEEEGKREKIGPKKINTNHPLEEKLFVWHWLNPQHIGG